MGPRIQTVVSRQWRRWASWLEWADCQWVGVGVVAVSGIVLAGCSADSVSTERGSAVDPNPITAVTAQVVENFDRQVTFTLADGSTQSATCPSTGGGDLPLGGGSCRYTESPTFLNGQKWYGYDVEGLSAIDPGEGQSATLTISAIGTGEAMETIAFTDSCTVPPEQQTFTCTDGKPAS